MSITAAVRIEYGVGERQIEGINEFSEELSHHYLTRIQGRRAGLRGLAWRGLLSV
jgi:hypothetical protein